MERPTRFELVTFGFVDQRSIRLSYGRMLDNYLRESNLPLRYLFANTAIVTDVSVLFPL